MINITETRHSEKALLLKHLRIIVILNECEESQIKEMFRLTLNTTKEEYIKAILSMPEITIFSHANSASQ